MFKVKSSHVYNSGLIKAVIINNKGIQLNENDCFNESQLKDVFPSNWRKILSTLQKKGIILTDEGKKDKKESKEGE